jgi:hypothetical protein
MGTDANGVNSFPRQKIATTKKNPKWGERCIEAAEDLAIFRDPLIRQSYENKQINYDLYNDILDTRDIERVCNPMGLKLDSFPAKMQNYPLVLPKIDVLVGEERRRRFDYQVRVINDEAISMKEKAKKEEFKKFIMRHISADEIDKKELEQDIERFKSYMLYEWQDQLERRSRHIINYLYKTRNLKEMFSRGFEDVLIAGEEIYCVDIEAGEPTVRKCNPLNVHTLRSGESPWVNDADIIIEDGYYSHGMIMDKYHDDLTDKQIKMIEDGFGFEGSDDFISIGETERNIVIDGTLVDLEDDIRSQFGQTYDNEGNIRVMRVVWKSKRKVGKLKYYDEDGTQFEKIVDEKYKPAPTEEIKWVWISEWWEGTRIGGGGFGQSKAAIYIKIKKRPIQFRSIHNISKCHSGYVGLAYNTNVSKSKSLMDRMKPYQYLYNVFMYRTELAFAKAKGRIGKLNLAEMPDGWTPEVWMQYAEINGWLVTDAFNEAKRGAAQGKLAGQMSGSSTMIDLEMGNYIQQHILMLQFLETQLGQIAGITRQREGQIEQRETVRGVERSVSQSNLITEKYFGLHDRVKTQVLTILMETAKIAWKGNKQVLSYVTDELTEQVFEIEADDPVLDCDAGVILTSGQNDLELMQSLKEFAHAGLQNDKLSFKEIIDLYMDPSITKTRRKLEEAEAKRDKQMQEQQQQAEKINQQNIEAAQKADEANKAHEMNKIDKEYQYKMQIESMKAQMKNVEGLDRDQDDDGIIDEIEYERERTKLNIAQLKAQSDKLKLDTQLAHESKEKEKDRKHNEKIEKIRSKNKPAAK